VLARLAEVEGRGGLVFDCTACEAATGLASALAFADRAALVYRRNRTTNARRVLASAGGSGGRPNKLTPAKRKAALVDWRDPAMTAAQVAAKHGISRRKLFNDLGPRFPEGVQSHG